MIAVALKEGGEHGEELAAAGETALMWCAEGPTIEMVAGFENPLPALEAELPAIEAELPAVENEISIVQQTFVGVGPASPNGAIPYLKEVTRLENLADKSWWDYLTPAEQWIGITFESTRGQFTLRELVEMWEALFGETTWGSSKLFLP
jgi:hypothetical protein